MDVKVQIEGVTPLLMNRFTGESEVKLASGTSPVYAGEKGLPRQQAEKKLYADDKGNLFIPGANVFACIVEAGKFHKAGKNKLTTQKTSLIPAGLMVEEIVCPLNTKEWEVDSRSVVNPSTGGRVMCHRPRVDKWVLSFTLQIDETMFSPGLIRMVVDDAGKKVGLGDYRPQRKGPFGRFVVKHWEVIEVKIKDAA